MSVPRADWERGLRGRIYALGRRLLPLSLRRRVRRLVAPERLFGIRKPPVALQRFDFDPASPESGLPDILVLPVIPWSYRRQRPQQLAEALARRGSRVFYLSLEGSGEPGEPTGVAPGVLLLPIGGVAREDVAGRSLAGRALDQAAQSLARARDRFGLRDAAMIAQSPFWAPLAFQLRHRFGWRIVYDCLDEHAAFETNRPGLLRAPEQDLVSRADLVLATSEPLLERLRSWNPAARRLANACDYGLFARIASRAPDPERLVVGYAGAVDRWFDGALVAEIARLRPLWRFEIVGGLENEPSGLPLNQQNVVFFGERPHGETPAFRQRWDVEIIPFRLSDLTQATDPVKLYEAAAAGLPVVATPMRSLCPALERGIVRLAADARDFVREIEAAAAEPPGRAEERRAFARENTWDDRAGALVGWLAEAGHRITEGPSGPEGLVALARRRSALFHFPPSLGWRSALVQRPHHLAKSFARKGLPVLFESEAEADSPGAPREVEPGLFLASPRAVDLGPMPNRIVWGFATNLPRERDLEGARLVYDVIDHLDVFEGRRGRLRRNHERALGRAEAVFAVSRPLLDAVRGRRPDAVYLPNGVDAELFAGAPDPSLVPAELRQAREAGPVAGYVGALARWVDAELLGELARARPDWSFVLVGEPLDDSFRSLSQTAPENLRLLGPRPYSHMPSILSAFDVGLIPFRLGPEGSNASPIKLYEYLAAGLPVLATPIAECEALPEVATARGAAGFARELGPALERRASPDFRSAAGSRARTHDWSLLADTACRTLRLTP